MVHFNLARQELTCKVLYFGPEGAGKSASLNSVYHSVPPERCTEITEVTLTGAPESRYEHVQLKLGKFAGLRTRLQLYTIPARACPAPIREELWRATDGVIFVADSLPGRLAANRESLEALREVLDGPYVQLPGRSRRTVPIVFQWNKRDLPGALDAAALQAALNRAARWPAFETDATSGDGTLDALKKAATLALESLDKVYGLSGPAGRPRYVSNTVRVPRARRPLSRPASGEVAQPPGRVGPELGWTPPPAPAQPHLAPGAPRLIVHGVARPQGALVRFLSYARSRLAG